MTDKSTPIIEHDAEGRCSYVYFDGHGGNNGCRIWGPDSKRKNNANLIAAAPEMEKALEECRQALKYSYQVCDYPANGQSEQDDAIRTVDKVLAKARGGDA